MATDPQSQVLQSPMIQAMAARKAQSAQVPGRAQILQRMLAQARQQPQETPPYGMHGPSDPGAGGDGQTPIPVRPGLPGAAVPAAAPVVPQRPTVMAAPVARRYPVNMPMMGGLGS